MTWRGMIDDRMGQDIKSAELKNNNVYVQTAKGEVWRIWVDFDGLPRFELVKRA
jgi:uncharacterized membrane protein